jgi:hypothetical protein
MGHEKFGDCKSGFGKKRSQLDLGRRPAGYEGGGPPHYPIPFNRYEYDIKHVMDKILLVFAGFY